MNADIARDKSLSAVRKEINSIEDKISEACSKGVLSIYLNNITPASIRHLKKKGFVVTRTDCSNMSIFNISWE